MNRRVVVVIAVLIALIAGFGVHQLTSSPAATVREGDSSNENASEVSGTATSERDASSEPISAPDSGVVDSNVEDSTDVATGDESESTKTAAFVIAGEVLNADGAQLFGATVELGRHREGWFSGDALSMLRESPSGSVLAEVMTGADGEFRFELDAPGSYALRVHAPGYRRAFEGPIRLRADEPEVWISVPVTVGYEISGYVIDEASRPVAGAPVTALERSGSRLVSHQTVSAADGSFMIDGLAPTDHMIAVPVHSAGGATRPGTLVPSVVAPSVGVEIVLRGGDQKDVSARVVDADGNPVANAQITALNPVSFDVTHSAADGTFALALTGPDADVMVEAAGYAVERRRIDLSTAVQDFVLSRGSGERIEIVRANGGPAARVLVGVLEPSSFLGRLQRVRTDDEGTVSCQGVPARSQAMWLPKVRGEWLPFERARVAGDLPVGEYAPDGTPPPVGARGTRRVELEPTMTFIGQVVDSAGEPVANARVSLSPVNPRSPIGRAHQWLRGELDGWTDASGNFRIPDALPGVPTRVRVFSAGAAEWEREIGSLPPSIEVQLAPSGVVEFDVRSETGRGLEGVRILVQSPNGVPVSRRENGLYIGGVIHLGDSAGRTYVGSLGPGPHGFVVLAEGYVPRRIELDLEPGAALKERVELVPAAALRVSVDRGADPVPMARVTVVSNGGGVATRRRTGLDGICEFADLAPGTYTIQVESATGSSTSEVAELGAGFVEAKLRLDE